MILQKPNVMFFSIVSKSNWKMAKLEFSWPVMKAQKKRRAIKKFGIKLKEYEKREPYAFLATMRFTL